MTFRNCATSKKVPHEILIFWYNGSMSTRTYRHSAYWYAYHRGYTHSSASSHAAQYLDLHSYRPRKRRRRAGGESFDDDWRSSGRDFDSSFNPLLLGLAIAMDIGEAMYDLSRRLADPDERARMKAELRRDLRIVRRPLYYSRETKRRRELAAERRRITRRRTTAPMPTPEELLAAWNARKQSKEAMIRLGGMLHDLACYVDSALRIDEYGNVVGRNSGIRGWLKECLPELSPKYKTLMRYKAMAMKLRQATGTEDPTPTAKLLEQPRPELVETLLQNFRTTFSFLSERLEFLLSPETVLADDDQQQDQPERAGRGPKRRGPPADPKLAVARKGKGGRKKV